jgi:hypothetical protein
MAEPRQPGVRQRQRQTQEKTKEEIMKFEVTLATLDVTPALVARVHVEADDRDEARSMALAEDFADLEWTDTRGDIVPWDEVGMPQVCVAEVQAFVPAQLVLKLAGGPLDGAELPALGFPMAFCCTIDGKHHWYVHLGPPEEAEHHNGILEHTEDLSQERLLAQEDAAMGAVDLATGVAVTPEQALQEHREHIAWVARALRASLEPLTDENRPDPKPG